MFEIQGKIGKAVIMLDNIDDTTMKQLYQILGSPISEGVKIVIMPDAHAGSGSCIGFTSTLGKYISPNIIGVDIGCGVEAYKLDGAKITDFDKFDMELRRCVPAGFNKHTKIQNRVLEQLVKLNLAGILNELITATNQSRDAVIASLGTLGGGNHYIEIDVDTSGNQWLVVHSGSRNFGLQVANFHQKKAVEALKKEFAGAGAYHDAEYLSEDTGSIQYISDMYVAQEYASLNRYLIIDSLLRQIYGEFNIIDKLERIISIHNYINLSDNIIRKGAISAYEGQRVIIPLNMRDGAIVGVGKSNPDWNFSAPHGAGRLMSRSKAKKNIPLDTFKQTMEESGVWSSCISKDTLDESPMAYKDKQTIINAISPTVDIEFIMKPIYNFKAGK